MKMCVFILKSKYIARSKILPKDAKKIYSSLKKTKKTDQCRISKLKLANWINIFQNILFRNISDSVLTFYNLNLLSDALFDNLDLIKAFLNALFHSYIGIINFTLYEFDLDDSLKIKRQNITYKYSVDTIRIKEWNYCLLFKAYTGLVIIFFKK